MRIKIYCFSGTGNSLAIARKLGSMLDGDIQILAVPQFIGERNIDINVEVVGLVFPTYFLTVPDIIKTFIKKLIFKKDPYIFVGVTCNGTPGHSLFTLDTMLKEKGQRISAGFVIDMPGNALVTPIEAEIERLDNCHSKVMEMAEMINSRAFHQIEGDNRLGAYIKSYISGFFGKHIGISPRGFSINHKCTGCGTCAMVCPVKNINISDNKPAWRNHCERCLACFHWCPEEALYIGKFLGDRRKYHHPDVTVRDIIIKN